MKRLQHLIFQSRQYHKFNDLIKNTYVNRQHCISLHRYLQILFSQMRKDTIPERASSMAFSFLLSMFPAILFIFTLIPYIPVPELQETIMFSLKHLLPISIYNGVATAIYDILHMQHGGLMSFGFLFAIFSATNGMMAMITAFNRCYRTRETRGYLRKLLVALSIVFMLLGIVFVSIFIALCTKQLLNQLHLNNVFLYYLVLISKNLFFFLVFFFAISMIYYIAPAISVRWKFFSSGSLSSALLIVLFTFTFSSYLNSFDSYNKLYGSIGALIGIMLWTYAVSIMLLVGFEINASMDLAKKEAAKKIRLNLRTNK